ncbi:13S globulin basic chain-like [Magnolia sinica]|uniref:13S globulin basic chain-like n=1 Tax=Magnolia sinica TaxID=86752 RepID=UPI002657E650|nr:13S globulin basic chain-like [Magnolia sinica]
MPAECSLGTSLECHSMVYVTRGNGWVIVPEMFAVVKRAGNEGLEYITLKTNSDNAMTSALAGNAFALMNAYRISKKEARRLNYNRWR